MGLLYAITGWLILQVTDVLAGLFSLPDWTLRYVALVLLAGLPIALALSWFYEWTPQGVMREADLDRSTTTQTGSGSKANWAIMIGLVLAVSFLLVDRFVVDQRGPTAAAVPAVRQPISDASVAVLPFANMSANEDVGYFADGVAEEILHKLTAIAELRVASRTSSFRYRGSDTPIRQIGANLSVAHVLEGSVRLAGDKLRVTAQLINAEDGYHVWSETFDRPVEDIFAIQEEIALAIADAMQISLTIEEKQATVTTPTSDVDAYSLYLAGTQHIRARTEDRLEAAVRVLNAAVKQDPGYAVAWAALGQAYVLLDQYGNLTESDIEALALPALEKAIAIAPNLPEPHQAIGLYWLNRDKAQAIAALNKAVELGTRDANAYLWLGIALKQRPDPDYEASIAALEHGLELDPGLYPLYVNLIDALGWPYTQSVEGQGEQEALVWRRIELYDTLLSLVPDTLENGPHRYLPSLANEYYAVGEMAQAIQVSLELLAEYPRATMVLNNMIGFYEEIDDFEGVRPWLEHRKRVTEELFHDDPIGAMGSVWSRITIGEIASAVANIEDQFPDGNMPKNVARGLCESYLYLGRYADMLRICEKVKDENIEAGGPRPGSGRFFARLWFAAEQIGDPRAAEFEQVVRDQIKEQDGNPGVWGESQLIMVGDFAAALDMLESLAEWRGGWLSTGFQHDPIVQQLAGEPRFQQLIERWEAIRAEQREKLANLDLPHVDPLAVRPTISVSPRQLAQYTGTFADQNGVHWRVDVEDDHLMVQRVDANDKPIPLRPVGTHEFLGRRNYVAQVFFVADDQGRVSHLLVNPPYFQRVSRIVAEPAIQIPKDELSRLVGIYVADADDRFDAFEVLMDGDQLAIVRAGERQRLRARSATSFVAAAFGDSYNFEVSRFGEPMRATSTIGATAGYDWLGRFSAASVEPTDFVGRYRFGDGAVVDVEQNGDHLLWRVQGVGLRLLPETIRIHDANHLFFDFEQRTAEVRPARDESGRVEKLVIRERDVEHEATRCSTTPGQCDVSS